MSMRAAGEAYEVAEARLRARIAEREAKTAPTSEQV
jgi:hypothetical protein